jgi:glycine/D-amino acid oxidase-like deaminating enzyme
VGPDKAAALVTLETQYEQARREAGVPDGQPIGGLEVAVIGYRFAGYADTAATVHLLLRAPAPSRDIYGDSRVELRWQDGDWRVVAPPGGNWDATTVVVAAPAGYVGLGG